MRRVRNAAVTVAVGAVAIRVLGGLVEQALPAIFAIMIITAMAAAAISPRRPR